jgi:hypothetical protein
MSITNLNRTQTLNKKERKYWEVHIGAKIETAIMGLFALPGLKYFEPVVIQISS